MVNRINIKPLSLNEGYTGKRYKTNAHRAWHNDVLLMLPKLVVPDPPFEIHLKFGFSNKASDFDNCVKFAVDCLQIKYKFNDKLIRRAIIDTDIVPVGKEYFEFELLHLQR